MTNKLLTRTEQYQLQQEYGAQAWSADALGAMSIWPALPEKSGLFGCQSQVTDLERKLGPAFTTVFKEMTDWNNHQMDTTAFYYRQKGQYAAAYSYIGDQFAAVVVRKHKDDPTIEVTLLALLHGSTQKLGYHYRIGLEYQGDDEHFVPYKAPELSWGQALVYKWKGISFDNRYGAEKFPPVGRSRGAQVEYGGTVGGSAGELQVKVRDQRLETVAQEMFQSLESRLGVKR